MHLALLLLLAADISQADDQALQKQRTDAGILGTEKLKAGHPEEALPLYQKALAISRQRKDGEDEIFDLSSVGYCLRQMNKPNESMESYAAAASRAHELKLPAKEAAALDQSAQTALEYELLPQAQAAFEKAIDFNLQHGDGKAALREAAQLIFVWPELRPFWEMGPLLGRVLAANQGGEIDGLKARILLAYLDFLVTAGLHSEVQVLLEKSFTDAELTNLEESSFLRAERTAMLARIADARGEFPKAESIHRAAIDRYLDAKDLIGAAQAEVLLAEHYRQAGQYARALETCEKSIADARRGYSRLTQGRGWLCKAQVLAALGKRKEADEASGKAAKFGKVLGSKSLMAASLSAAAAAFRMPTQPGVVLQGPALEKFKADAMGTLSATKNATEMYSEFHDGLSLGREMVLAAPTFIAIGELDAAGTLASLGRDGGHSLGDRQLEANAVRLAAEVALARKKPDEARRQAAQALAIAEETGDAENAARIWDVLARVESQAGHGGAAILFRKQAVNAVQTLRGNAASLSRELRASQTRSKENIYRDLAGDLLRDGRLAEAEQVLSMLKEQEFFAFLRHRVEGEPRTVAIDLDDAERPWVARYEGVRTRLAKLGRDYRRVKPSTALVAPELLEELFAGQIPKDASLQAARIEPQLEAAREELSSTLQEAASPQLSAPRAARPGLLQSKLSTLPQGTVALYYVVRTDKLHLLLATPKGSVHREVAVSEDRLAELVGRFRELLQLPYKDPRPTAKALYDLLVAPVEAELKDAKTVMLALDKGLRYVPFGALYDGKQYLVQREQLTVYTPAAGGSVDRPPRKGWTVAALGVSEAAGGFESLPGVPAELADIVKGKDGAGVLPGVALLDKAFTRAALAEALRSKPAVLHIASHFAFDADGTEAESFLLLGGGGQLTLADFSAGEFPVDQLDLLTLSACQTGVGATGRDGVEVEGFGVLAQRKGAAAVMATLWPVADATTSLFMREFYARHEKEGIGKAAAVRATQVGFITGQYNAASLSESTRGFKRIAKEGPGDADAPHFTPDPRAPYAHPMYWAPFILMGNGL